MTVEYLWCCLHWLNTANAYFVFAASVVFMIWSAVEHKRPACIYVSFSCSCFQISEWDDVAKASIN